MARRMRRTAKNEPAPPPVVVTEPPPDVVVSDYVPPANRAVTWSIDQWPWPDQRVSGVAE